MHIHTMQKRRTSIAVTNETLELLQKHKVHPNQSYREVIEDALKKVRKSGRANS